MASTAPHRCPRPMQEDGADAETRGTASPPAISRWVTVMLAVAAGAAVANLYYAQPLLGLLAHSFGTSLAATAGVITATQLGYAVSLLLVLPLGDLVENRRLVLVILLFTALALVGAAVAPTFGLFLVLSVLVGSTSVVAQVLVPLAADLAPADRRGTVVGQVISGLLLGILLARSVSSVIADALGWRAVFWLSAALMLVVAIGLRWILPRRRPPAGAGYLSTLRSVGRLVREQPELRRRSVAQGIAFATFTVFWTTIAYHLVTVFKMSQTGIALFALVGAAGALSAPLAGKVADAGYGRLGRGISLTLLTVSMVIAARSGHNLVVLTAAAVLLDFATQTHQVIGQQTIYSLVPEARARLNSVYMTTAFLGGALASTLSGWVYQKYGWVASSALAASIASVGVLIWIAASVHHRGVNISPRRSAKMNRDPG